MNYILMLSFFFSFNALSCEEEIPVEDFLVHSKPVTQLLEKTSGELGYEGTCLIPHDGSDDGYAMTIHFKRGESSHTSSNGKIRRKFSSEVVCVSPVTPDVVLMKIRGEATFQLFGHRRDGDCEYRRDPIISKVKLKLIR